MSESMQHSINLRTLVLAETAQKNDVKHESGGVYAVINGYGRFVVNRIKNNSINTTGILMMHSENETYGCIDVPADEINRM